MVSVDSYDRLRASGASPAPPSPSPTQDLADLLKGLGVSGVGQGGAGYDPSDPRVYLTHGIDPRYTKYTGGSPDAYDRRRTQYQPRIAPLSQAKLEIYKWSDGQRRRFWDRLVSAGLVGSDEPYNFGKLQAIWEDFAGKSAEASMATGKPMTPYDMIGLYAGSSGYGGGGTARRPRNVTTRQTNLTDSAGARSLLTQMLSQKLGRRATDTEVDDFHQALNSAEENNPVITTTHYDAEGNATNSKTKGGLDRGGYTEHYSDSKRFRDEFRYVQASTTYFNALMQAIASPIPGGG